MRGRAGILSGIKRENTGRGAAAQKKRYNYAGARNGKARAMRSHIWLWVLIGWTVGSLIPDLWGAGLFSYSSVWLGGAGALLGLWLGYKAR